MKYYTVKDSNGNIYGVPAELIAQNYAQHYYEKYGEDYGENFQAMMEWYDKKDYEFADWAKNNMDWSDVAEKAVLLGQEQPETDMQETWVNGEYGFVEQE